MADGSSGGLSGVLFEAGKTISDAGKKQAQQTAQSAFSSLTGSSKQLFNAKSSNITTPPAKPLGQIPKQNPLGNLGNLGGMFEKGASSPFGSKTQTPQAAQPAFTQADLDAMAAQNSAKDAQEIAKREAELEAIKQQAHQARHDEVYYNQIRNIGANTMAESRQQKEQQQQQEEAQKQEEAQNQMQDLSGGMFKGSPLSQNGQLGAPVAVRQAKTQTEANRGTTG